MESMAIYDATANKILYSNPNFDLMKPNFKVDLWEENQSDINKDLTFMELIWDVTLRFGWELTL